MTTENTELPASPLPPHLLTRIDRGETVRGLLTEIAHPMLIELCGHARLDFACLDFEHGAISDSAAEAAVRAADSVRLPVLARVRADELPRATRFLDAGGAGIIVAHVSNLEQVKVAAAALLLPPLGRRGVGVTRNSRLGFEPTNASWAANQNSNLILGMQIEDAEGEKNTAEIAGHPSVSVILVGTRDLSFDLGIPGLLNDRMITESLKRIRAGCAGRAALGLMVHDLAGQQLLDAGLIMIGLGTLIRYSTDRLSQFR